jgi:hypothetical protein
MPAQWFVALVNHFTGLRIRDSLKVPVILPINNHRALHPSAGLSLKAVTAFPLQIGLPCPAVSRFICQQFAELDGISSVTGEVSSHRATARAWTPICLCDRGLLQAQATQSATDFTHMSILEPNCDLSIADSLL